MKHSQVNIDIISARILQEIATHEAYIAALAHILPVIKAQEGKQVSARIATALSKAVDGAGYKVYRNRYGYINVWGSGIAMGRALEFRLLSYACSDKFSYDETVGGGLDYYINLPDTVASLRATHRELPSLVAQYNAAVAAADTAYEAFGQARYTLHN